MARTHEGLPATSLLLIATALLLFGAAGGLVGYMAGERHGQQRAERALQLVSDAWDSQGDAARKRFDRAIGDAASRLEIAAAGLRTQVSMYHGCGTICSTIAAQFSAELLDASHAIKQVELAAPPRWADTIMQDTDRTAVATRASIEIYSGAAVIVAVNLLCATVVLCFGIACFALSRRRATETPAA